MENNAENIRVEQTRLQTHKVIRDEEDDEAKKHQQKMKHCDNLWQHMRH